MADRIAAASRGSQACLGTLYSIAILCSKLPALVAWMLAARVANDAQNAGWTYESWLTVAPNLRVSPSGRYDPVELSVG